MATEAPQNGVSTTLAASITNTATALSLTSPTGWTNAQYHVTITDGTNTEIATATALSGTTLTVIRASESWAGSAIAYAFASGASITITPTVVSVQNLINQSLPSPASTVVGPDSFGASAVVGTGTTFARADHNHGLPAAPAVPVTSVFTRTGAVTATAGDYTVSEITGAAPLASPALTGTPTAPTAAPATNTTQVATTAFTTAAIAAIPAAGPLATAREIAVGTVATTIVTYTPAAARNCLLAVYFRVITATTNVTITVTWTDATGAQTLTLVNNVAEVVGSYAMNSFIIDSTATAITISMTAGTAAWVFGSATILPA